MRISLTRRALIDAGLLVLVNAMWAVQYAAYKTASRQIGPITISGWTFLMASIVLVPFLMKERHDRVPATGSPGDSLYCHGSRERSFWVRENMVAFMMVAILGIVPASVFLAWGESHSTASNAALIYLTVPIITAVLAVAILKENLTPVRWMSLAISLTGVLILSEFDWQDLTLGDSKYLFGNLLVLAACTSSAFYNVYCKGLLRRFTPLEVLIYGYALAFAISLPLLIWAERFSLRHVRTYTGSTWLALIALSTISWGLAMVLWMFLLKRLDVSLASVSIYLLPLFGVLVSAITLNERVTPNMVAGGAVTLLGTILVTSTEKRSP